MIATIIKTWWTWSRGTWCTWEYFNLQLITINWDEINNRTFNFEWLYWVESRVQALLKEKWATILYNSVNYWQLKKKDIYPNTLTETEILKELNILFTNNTNNEYN